MAGGALWEWYKRERAAVRSSFEEHLTITYEAADEDCKGVLLNRLGLKNNIDPQSLFEGPFSRVEKYASEELYDWFAKYGRITYSRYEDDYVRGMNP